MRYVSIIACLAFCGCAPLDMGVEPEPSVVDRDAVRFVPIESGTDAELTGVWGSDPTDVWVVGWTEPLRWQGARMIRYPLPQTRAPGPLEARGIVGLGPDDIRVVGRGSSFAGQHPMMWFDGRAWTYQPSPAFNSDTGNALWIDGSGGIWAAGDYGSVRFWDGSEWHDRGPDPLENPFFRGAMYGIWAADAGDVWAVGHAPVGADPETIAHFDGQAWRFSPAPERLLSVWGTGSDDVWSVGRAGVATRWDGRAWSLFETGTDVTLRAVVGTGTDAVWAVGDGGTILFWDGVSWGSVESGTDADLRAIWLGDGVVWVVGSQGTILRYVM